MTSPVFVLRPSKSRSATGASQYFRDEDLGDRRRAIAVNADSPHACSEFASAEGFRIIMMPEAYGRRDLPVLPRQTGTPVDRTLCTVHPDHNARLWAKSYRGQL